MIRPEKWNYPEIDGMYVYSEDGGLSLLAWNASCAEKHKGAVDKLYTLLEKFLTSGGTTFKRVRFAFIVPIDNFFTFTKPDRLDGKILIPNYGFTNFEVFGVQPTT
jgi:hypothetical protein